MKTKLKEGFESFQERDLALGYEGTDTNSGTDIFGKLKIPRRSEFYHLKPIGINTPFVESLGGYAARLSLEHFVTPTILIKRVIPLAASLKNMVINFSPHHRAVNGTGIIASSLYKALESLTMRRDLAWTTMVLWSSVLPARSLIRRHRVWCSTCYETWLEKGDVVYEPLLWALESVTICPLHNVALTSCCPSCKSQLLHFDSRAQPGFCTRCKAWLGISPEASSSPHIDAPSEDAKWQFWKAESVGELLANAPRATIPTRDRVAKSLRHCIDRYSWGRSSRFASQFKVSLKRLQGWLRGERTPILETVLQLTYKMGISPLNFLTGNLEDECGSIENGAKSTSGNPRFHKGDTPRTYDEVKEILTSAISCDQHAPLQEYVRITGWTRRELQRDFPDLCAAILTSHGKIYYRRIDENIALPILQVAQEEHPPHPLVAVAARIGCHPVSLRYHYPEITNEIINRYKDFCQNHDWKHVEGRLKEFLHLDPPRSLSKTAQSLGIPTRTLRNRFPKLVIAIARRYERCNKAQQEVRKKQVRKEILEAFMLLVAKGVYPSVKRVAARIKASRNMLEIRLVLREVKLETAHGSNTNY